MHHIFEVLIEGRLGQLVVFDLYLAALGFLGPKEGNRASDLNMGAQVLSILEVQDDLGLHEVGHVSLLVDSTCVEASASHAPAST